MQHQHCGVLVLICNIGRCRKFGLVPFLYRTQSAGKDFELILKVKMETRYPVEGQFGSEFPAICNHGGLKSQDLEIL